MTKSTHGLVRELVEVEREAGQAFFARHKMAGGQCERPAVLEVYGLAFCEVHGAEVKARALEELYCDAAMFIQRLDNREVPKPNPAALEVIQEGWMRLEDAQPNSEPALERAYLCRRDLLDEEADTSPVASVSNRTWRRPSCFSDRSVLRDIRILTASVEIPTTLAAPYAGHRGEGQGC